MLTQVKWKNHPILKELSLDFKKPDGTPYNTIILAGENGTGKTTILDTFANFLNRGSIEPFATIQYEINATPYTIVPMLDKETLGFHTRTNDNTNVSKAVTSSHNNNPQKIDEDKEDIRHYGFAYSRARTGFNTQQIRTTTTQQLDKNKYEIDNNDDFTSIKQLLVDIDTQDNAEWREICETTKASSLDEFKKTSKMYRFKTAFDNFFPFLKFKKIDNNNLKEKKILFEKYGNSIEIDKLSTGEKQVIFRGAFLLKNNQSISGGIILIDEPELSMHPSWQQNILQYYRRLFVTDHIQTAQLIIATHSEYILHAALKDPNNVLIIVLQDAKGTITPRHITAPHILPTITAAETKYLAFNIVSVDYHNELYGYLQNKTGNHTVKACDEYIMKQPGFKSKTHTKEYTYNKTIYKTLPTYIRNVIDHPDLTHTYSEKELKDSIELLITLCQP